MSGSSCVVSGCRVNFPAGSYVMRFEMFARWPIFCLLMYAAAAQSAEGPEILQTRCGGCHQQSATGHFARISNKRKTSEGWLMTIFRIQHVHQVQITEADRYVLIRYLAYTRGRAPAGARPA